jgi:hypothetical protein
MIDNRPAQDVPTTTMPVEEATGPTPTILSGYGPAIYSVRPGLGYACLACPGNPIIRGADLGSHAADHYADATATEPGEATYGTCPRCGLETYRPDPDSGRIETGPGHKAHTSRRCEAVREFAKGRTGAEVMMAQTLREYAGAWTAEPTTATLVWTGLRGLADLAETMGLDDAAMGLATLAETWVREPGLDQVIETLLDLAHGLAPDLRLI